ncbi:MAG TPA: RHS repeat-associated core domain-containing protein [Terracidiphilus sp.]|nr:RHS repeat-associated core domain-containing protein [Terracidiphilus sp.]
MHLATCTTRAHSWHPRSTGKERDTESGNDYFGARYYASTMGRFMSPDPLPWIHWQRGDKDDQQKFAAYIEDPQNLNMYAYVTNNPLAHTDPTGMSDLIFDGQAHTITLVSKDGQVIGTWNAGNNVAIHAPPGEGGGAYTHGPIQDGTYSVASGDQHGATTHLNGSPDSAFGANGIIHIPDAKGATGDTLSGAGVHSGREDKGGPDAKTAGCIRTTDEAMSTINSTAKSDPLKTVTVQNNSQNVQQWNATAAAVKKKDGQQ